MEIKKSRWESMDAVVLENGLLKAVVLPGLGGKTASLFYKPQSFELFPPVQNGRYCIPDAQTAFESCDASGFDDAFPTILAYQGEEPGLQKRYTDHGEIWRSPFTAELHADHLALSYQSAENGYRYEKRISLNQNSVHYQYAIRNLRETPFPCLWAMHDLVRYEEDMELIFPAGTKRFRNVAEGPWLGTEGEIWEEHPTYDFFRVPSRDSLAAVKYYVEGPVAQGRCGYRYPSQRVQCEIFYDPEKLPYLGFWITAGGFRGDYNCAMEPANGFYDSVEKAAETGTLYQLMPGDVLEFCVEFRLKSL